MLKFKKILYFIIAFLILLSTSSYAENLTTTGSTNLTTTGGTQIVTTGDMPTITTNNSVLYLIIDDDF